MARHSHDRTNQIQTDAPKAPPTAPSEPAKSAATPRALSWGWQVAVFIWLVSFVFLFLNDLLTIVFKLATRAGS
jgi:hypothetical protein